MSWFVLSLLFLATALGVLVVIGLERRDREYRELSRWWRDVKRAGRCQKSDIGGD